LLLHGAGILVAKLVILAVGALFAMLVSTTVQAGFPVEDDLRSTPAQLETEQTQLSVNLFHQSDSTKVLGLKAERRQVDGGANRQNLRSDFNSPHHRLTDQFQGFDQNYHAVFRDSELQQRSALRLFKAYFPDINQTPGQALSSNGVGLNSPPALHLSIVVPASFSFRVIRQTFPVSPACCAVQSLKSVKAKALSIAINSVSNLQFISNHLRISHVY
jgi:urease accessory protein